MKHQESPEAPHSIIPVPAEGFSVNVRKDVRAKQGDVTSVTLDGATGGVNSEVHHILPIDSQSEVDHEAVATD